MRTLEKPSTRSRRTIAAWAGSLALLACASQFAACKDEPDNLGEAIEELGDEIEDAGDEIEDKLD